VDGRAFASQTGVSRETLDRLQIYADALVRWNRAINLVAPGSLKDLWRRHILDSWQVADMAPTLAGNWIDLGSGGGFPGLVAAACQDNPVMLIESDQRKCVFLRETARKMGVDVTVVNGRIEEIEPVSAAVVSARALAALPRLLEWAQPFCNAETRLLLLKGQDVASELTEATKYWTFELEQHPSLSDSRGVVLSIGKLVRHA
jgi:16S rRNA (guanine527-N7)-methyltransferase